MSAKKGTKCVNCGDKSEDGVVDMMGRFWCEDCVIFILADQEPRSGKRR